MDTGSHIMMGIGLAGLASTDPNLVNDSVTAQYILATTISASLIPDIDVLLKLKGNNVYINNHRGISHSIIVLFLWSLLIPFVLKLINSNINYDTLLKWSTIGVFLHVGTDLLNGYGTQFLWPFHKKWIGYGITYTFDAFVILTHGIAITLAFFFRDYTPIIFLTLYISLSIYVLIQAIHHYALGKFIKKSYINPLRVLLISKSLPHTWRYIVETKDGFFHIGVIKGKKINELDHIEKVNIENQQFYKLIKSDLNMRTFLNFSPIYNWTIKQLADNILEIRAYDLRYQTKGRSDELIYAFTAICKIKNNEIIHSYMGFVYDEYLLQKLLHKEVSFVDYIQLLKKPT